MTNYRGKYPNRIKSVSYSRSTGWHVETNRGDRFKFTSQADQAAIVAAYPLRGIEPGMDIFDVLANVPATDETEQPATLYCVTGRSVDGREYLTPFGWQGDKQCALVMPLDDATRIAEAEEKKQSATRNLDCGIYGIAATQWRGPSLYSFADYERDACEVEELDSVYGYDGDEDTSHLPCNGYRYRDFPGQG